MRFPIELFTEIEDPRIEQCKGHFKKISGVSILGDGKVILVLNPDYLT